MRLVCCVLLTAAAHVQVGAQTPAVRRSLQAGGESPSKVQSEVIAEEPEPSDPKEREVRRAKNVRYNAGRADLTKRDPDVEGFVEQIWPRVEFIPASESAIVVTGRVVKVQPYLSGDRSRIYTEITVAVDDLLKRDRDKRLSAAHTVLIDRLGGALKLKTGRIVRDDIQIDYLGKPQLGKRYVFFAKEVNDGSDVSLIKSYELVDGKVFTNDSRPSRLISTLPGVPQVWADEAAFLKAVREVTAENARTERRRRRPN